MKNNIKVCILSWNARGLYDKKTQLIQLINKTKSDIVLVQETLINNETKTGKKISSLLKTFQNSLSIEIVKMTKIEVSQFLLGKA